MDSSNSKPEGTPDEETRLGGCLRRVLSWRLTWRGWVVLVVLVLASVSGFLRGIHPFLAISDPVEAEVLVVEGWVGDNAFSRR